MSLRSVFVRSATRSLLLCEEEDSEEDVAPTADIPEFIPCWPLLPDALMPPDEDDESECISPLPSFPLPGDAEDEIEDCPPAPPAPLPPVLPPPPPLPEMDGDDEFAGDAPDSEELDAPLPLPPPSVDVPVVAPIAIIAADS